MNSSDSNYESEYILDFVSWLLVDYLINIDCDKLHNQITLSRENTTISSKYVIVCDSPQSELVKLTIYNFAMQKVREIDYLRGQGQGSLKWDGRDDSGYLVSNGTYFCKLFYFYFLNVFRSIHNIM